MKSTPAVQSGIQDAEERLSLLEALSFAAGMALDDVSPELLRGRLDACLRAEGTASATALLGRALEEPACLARLLRALAYRAGPLDGYPEFAAAFSNLVIPLLKTYPSVRIWMPACSTGFQAYLLANVLAGAGIYHRCRIYATDINPAALACASAGAYSEQAVAGSIAKLGEAVPLPASPYLCEGGLATFAPSLKANIVFAQHSLATDAQFNQFQLVVAHGRLGLFDPALAARAEGLFSSSLVRLGFLCLDGPSQEPADAYDLLDPAQRIYRKVRS